MIAIVRSAGKFHWLPIWLPLTLSESKNRNLNIERRLIAD